LVAVRLGQLGVRPGDVRADAHLHGVPAKQAKRGAKAASTITPLAT